LIELIKLWLLIHTIARGCSGGRRSPRRHRRPRNSPDSLSFADHGRTPVHKQIAKMYGQVTEHAQMEFARAMPAKFAKPLQVKPGSPALTVIRRYYGAREELFEVTVTTHPEGAIPTPWICSARSGRASDFAGRASFTMA
jgi:hypothetical protein